jgi:electron transport complex protein RnfC
MSRARSFSGGTHPPGNKELSRSREIVKIPVPETLTVSLCQHLGAPSTPVVKPGDSVGFGQVLGEKNGFISLPTHSPAAGKVVGLVEAPMPHRRLGPAVVISVDGAGEEPVYEPWPDWVNRSPEELIGRIRDAGVCGMGGACFPTFVKLSPPPDKKIDTLIINGVECEPYLTADHRLMLENPDDVIEGMRILAMVLRVENPCIGIEVNKPDAIELMEKKGVRVVPLRVSYPQGAEKQLIHAVCRRKVPAGGLPLDIGVVVQNVGTCAAVAQAVRDGIPSVSRVTTVTGRGVGEPGNFLCSVGTPVSRLVEAAGGYGPDVRRLISGGPMMGIAVHTDEVPVTKGTSGVLALSSAEARETDEGPCIRCGRCVDSCPLNLVPSMIARASEYGKWEAAREFGALNCMACGTCSYVCPSGRYLVHYIKRAQNEIRAMARAGKGS